MSNRLLQSCAYLTQLSIWSNDSRVTQLFLRAPTDGRPGIPWRAVPVECLSRVVTLDETGLPLSDCSTSTTSAAGAYGREHAGVYDRIYGARFAPEDAVTTLARLGRGGGVLELGVGTGRLAIPLAQHDVRVDGIEGSQAMVDQLSRQAGADRVGVIVADLADFQLPYRAYSVAVCAVSTLFMLSPDAQRSCIQASARHLRPGGLLLIEAFQPDPTRFDTHGDRTEHRDSEQGTHTVRSHHYPQNQTVSITHVLGPAPTITGASDRDHEYNVTLHYRTLTQLDHIAAAVGLTAAFRWNDWSGAPYRPESRDPISGYQLT